MRKISHKTSARNRSVTPSMGKTNEGKKVRSISKVLAVGMADWRIAWFADDEPSESGNLSSLTCRNGGLSAPAALNEGTIGRDVRGAKTIELDFLNPSLYISDSTYLGYSNTMSFASARNIISNGFTGGSRNMFYYARTNAWTAEGGLVYNTESGPALEPTVAYDLVTGGTIIERSAGNSPIVLGTEAVSVAKPSGDITLIGNETQYPIGPGGTEANVFCEGINASFCMGDYLPGVSSLALGGTIFSWLAGASRELSEKEKKELVRLLNSNAKIIRGRDY